MRIEPLKRSCYRNYVSGLPFADFPFVSGEFIVRQLQPAFKSLAFRDKAVRKGQAQADTQLQDSIKAQKAEQTRLDNERNRKIQAEIELKSEHGKVKQMIQQLHIRDVVGEVKFNYVLANKVKSLLVN